MMGDPLSVTASAVSVVCLGLQVLMGLVELYENWYDFDGDAKTDTISLSSLEKTLSLLEGSLKDALTDSEAQRAVERCVLDCSASMDRLRSKWNKIQCSSQDATGANVKGQAVGRVLKKQLSNAQYPFKRSTLVKLQEIVSELRHNLALALHVLNL